MKSILVLHKSCCLVYICHAVLKVRTGPAAEAWNETYSSFFRPKTMTEDFGDVPASTLFRFPLQSSSAETVQYSCGRLKPCHCVVSCQQLRDFTIAAKAKVDRVQVAELLSQHYNYKAPMIQLYGNKARESHDAPGHMMSSLQANVNNRNDCVSFISCARKNKLTLRWPWLKSGGDNSQSQPEWAFRWAADYDSQTQFTCWGEQSVPDKGRQCSRETSYYEEEFGAVSLTMQQTKGSVVFSSRWVLFFFFFIFVGLLWWIIALITWFHNAVTRLSVPV